MRSGSESDVQDVLQILLDILAPGRFWCRTRKSTGGSMIGKPVDLEIRLKEGSRRVVIAVEVANVNTTQLVGETCRLFYDTCPAKLLVLGDRNVPANGKEQSESILARLYGQDKIENTPARIVWFFDHVGIMKALADLLVLELPTAVPGAEGAG